MTKDEILQLLTNLLKATEPFEETNLSKISVLQWLELQKQFTLARETIAKDVAVRLEGQPVGKKYKVENIVWGSEVDYRGETYIVKDDDHNDILLVSKYGKDETHVDWELNWLLPNQRNLGDISKKD